MFINLNYSLSIILHILIVCFLIFVFKIEKQINIYNDVININLKTLKTLNTKDIAKEKNLLALLGLGASPGITNLLGRIAIDHLDIAHTIYTGWNLEEAQPEPISSQKETNAAMIHGIEQITGKVKVLKDGKFEMVNPLEEIKVSYPNIGTYSAFIFGHPEAITFPYHFKDLINSINLAHGNKSTIFVLKIISIMFLSIECSG